jgi:hypothetical protein
VEEAWREFDKAAHPLIRPRFLWLDGDESYFVPLLVELHGTLSACT